MNILHAMEMVNPKLNVYRKIAFAFLGFFVLVCLPLMAFTYTDFFAEIAIKGGILGSIIAVLLMYGLLPLAALSLLLMIVFGFLSRSR